MEPFFLLLETSTNCCSVALTQGCHIIDSRQSDAPKAHASLLTVFVDELLREHQMRLTDCSAVAVSSGPGSYTGLRVGVSTAKGLCFGAGIPLIGVGSLDLLAQAAIDAAAIPFQQETAFFIPLIDARRMEVYTSVFQAVEKPFGLYAQALSAPEAQVLDENSFSAYLEKGLVFFCGDGAAKFRTVCTHENARFLPILSHATAMAKAAFTAFNEKNFQDTAYFTPFYLKEFVAGISTKKVF